MRPHTRILPSIFRDFHTNHNNHNNNKHSTLPSCAYVMVILLRFVSIFRFDYGEKFWIVKYRTFRCHCGEATCRYSDDTIQQTLDQYNQRIAAEN